MNLRRFQVTSNPERPWEARVYLDGMDLSEALSSVSVRLQPGCMPQVEAELAVTTVEISGEAEARVYLSDAAREALVALGWTAPAGEVL